MVPEDHGGECEQLRRQRRVRGLRSGFHPNRHRVPSAHRSDSPNAGPVVLNLRVRTNHLGALLKQMLTQQVEGDV